MQGVGADIGHHCVTGREQQGLPVSGKLPGDIVLNIQKRVNSLIVSVSQIQRIVRGDLPHHLERHSAVNGNLPLRNHSGGVHGVEHVPEIVNSLGNLLLARPGAVRRGENQDYVVLPAKGVVGFGIFRTFLVARQKPGDVLLVVKP